MNTKKSFQELPEVSVIIPVYRVEDYINQCVDSVLSQTFKDFEIILVDDGSTDNCGAICDEYIKYDERIKVIHKSNGGLSDARNAGLELAAGKYIYFLDSDDWINENLLEIVIAYIREGYDLVAFNSYWAEIDGNSAKITHLSAMFEIDDDLSRNEFYIGTFLLSKIGWSAWDRVFKRSIIEDNGIRFVDNNKIFLEDLYFISLDDRLLYYRQRENSILHTEKTEVNFNRINELAKAVYCYYKNHDDCDGLLSIFPQIYFRILFNYLVSYRNNQTMELVRTIMLNDVSDKEFMIDQLKQIKKQPYISEKAYSKKKFYEMKSNATFLINNNSAMYKLRNKIISVL